jgi:chaperonin cofactor prefoldin
MGGEAAQQETGTSRIAGINREEAYWRSRARGLLSQMAAVDQQIEKVKEEIKKYGNGGFDPSTGLGKNVIYVDDRQSQLTRLQKQRSDLDKQMDQLQEEGRKAGAQPAWFR